MNFLDFLSTGFAVLLGCWLALSLFWPKVQAELKQRDEQKKPVGDSEAERLDNMAKKIYEKDDAFYKQLADERKKIPYFDMFGQGKSTSEEYNAKWAMDYFKQLKLHSTLFANYAKDADEFSCLVGSLYELCLCYHDLWLGEEKLNYDEELLEIERLRRDPHAMAHHLRAIRRHNEILPLVRGRLECRRWRLHHDMKFWEYVHQGMRQKDADIETVRKDADAKATVEMGPQPEWPRELGVFGGHYRRYFYLRGYEAPEF